MDAVVGLLGGLLALAFFAVLFLDLPGLVAQWMEHRERMARIKAGGPCDEKSRTE